MTAQWLPVIGIRPADESIGPAEGSIGPAGLHLRWAFPTELGFPRDGFEIFRRATRALDLDCADFSKTPAGKAIPRGVVVSGQGSGVERWDVGMSFRVHEAVTLSGTGSHWLAAAWAALPDRSGPYLMEIAFAEPVIAVEIRFRDLVVRDAPTILRAYDEQGALVARSAGSGVDGSDRRRVVGPAIAKVTVPLTFQGFVVCGRSHAVACVEKWPRKVAELPLLRPPQSEAEGDDGIKQRLGTRVSNRYARDLPHAQRRYRPGLAAMLGWLRALVTRDPTRFVDPTVPFDRLVAKPPSDQARLTAIYPQALLLLTALDPNVARLLSLYWADEFVADGEPVVGGAYDYKVVGYWPDLELCGFAFGLGAAVHGRPELDPAAANVEGASLLGVRWKASEPLRRVGVRWRRPPVGAPESPVRPILFDVWRAQQLESDAAGDVAFGSARRLTEEHPVLVPATAWAPVEAATIAGDARPPRDPRATQFGALFVDADVPLGAYRYDVAGIDLFGQVGKPVAGSPVVVQDLEAPPPPVRLVAGLVQPGYPWRTADDRALSQQPAMLGLTFEYGAFQHRQAPDAGRFNLYWRSGGLLEALAVEARVVASEPRGDGATAYTVEVTAGGGVEVGDLGRFVGGVLSTHVPEVGGPAAAARRHFRISALEAPHRLRLAPSGPTLVDGAYSLVADPHDPKTWTRIATAEVPALGPIEGRVRGLSETLAVTAAEVHALDAAPADPLALLPPGTRAAEPPPPPPAAAEAVIDRALLEPDLFAGGTATTEAGTVVAIRYSTAVPAYGPTAANVAGRARIGLAEAVPAGQTLVLRAVTGATSGAAEGGPADDRRDHVRLLELAVAANVPTPEVAGGEIAFTVEREGEPVLMVARVVSALDRQPGRLGMLVRFPAALDASELPRPDDRVRHFAPYAVPRLDVAVTAAVPPSASAGLRVTIPPEAGTVAAYLALSTTDVRGNEGPLSTPAQVVAVRPPPIGAPTAPFPCGTQGATAGYASPPDRQGRATVCLSWTYQGAGVGVRYEVARALDSGVVATARRNWLLGRAGTEPAALQPLPIVAGPSLRGKIAGPVTEQGGIYRATVEDEVGASIAAGPELAAALAGGRLVQDGRRYQVTRALGGADLVLLLRPLPGPEPPLADVVSVIDGPPDYSAVGKNPDLLRELAAKAGNEDAFNLVTGVPITGQAREPATAAHGEPRFLDEVPGLGRNAFFYRVRAVDAAENRSDWSPVSVPFWQTDTTPPDSPRDLQALAGDRFVELRWAPPPDPSVESYLVYRVEGSDDAFPLPAQPVEVPLSATRASRYTVIGRRVTLPARVVGAVPDATTIRALDVGAGGPNLYVLDSNLTRLTGRRLAPLNPLVPDGTPVRVIVGDPGSPTVLTSRPGSGEPLTVQGGGVELDVDLDESSVHVVERADGAGRPGAGDLRLPEASRLVLEHGTGRVVGIERLNPFVADGTPVSVTLVNEAGATSFDEDAAVRTWRDQDVLAGRRYAYRLAAARKVRSTAANGAVLVRMVRSEVVGPAAATPFDTTPAPPPALTVEWIDPTTGGPSGPTTSQPVVRLTLATAVGAAAFGRVQRAPAESGPWSNPLGGAGPGWQGWPPDRAELVLQDDSPLLARPAWYRAQLRTPDDRASPAGPPVRLAPLANGG